MRILLYHPVLMPVLRYGGTERVALWLATGLKELGHSVTVLAAPGSSMPDGIECLTDPAEMIKRAKEFDVFHGFSRPSVEMEEAFGGRVMMTVHGNGQRGEKFHRNTVFISENHARRHGATEFVYNGLDPNELLFSDAPRPNRFLFLSKTSWRVKNLKGAVRYSKQYKQNLWIAGGDRPYSLRLQTWMQKVMGRDWNWVGSVDQEQKAKFLLEGKAMVFPLLWNEPFGLVMVESLVSGTPVLANAYGSVPEILKFAPQCVMRSEEDWKRAMQGKIAFPSAKECRDWAISQFDRLVMAKNYVKLYERVARGEKLHAIEPETKVTAEDIG